MPTNAKPHSLPAIFKVTASIKTITTLILLSFFDLADAQTINYFIPPDSNLVFKTADMEGVIFGQNFKVRYNTESSDPVEIDPVQNIAHDEKALRYVPSIETVVKIEAELKAFIHDSSSFISDSLHLYIKQYFGYISSGDTIVCINSFYDDEIEAKGNWKSSFVIVFDGGHKYFSLHYNLSRKKFFNLWINGH